MTEPERLGLPAADVYTRFFRTVHALSADDVERTKPDPACYRLALARMGLQPHSVLAVEDTAHGVEAAVGAGLRCIAIPTALSSHHDLTTPSWESSIRTLKQLAEAG